MFPQDTTICSFPWLSNITNWYELLFFSNQWFVVSLDSYLFPYLLIIHQISIQFLYLLSNTVGYTWSLYPLSCRYLRRRSDRSNSVLYQSWEFRNTQRAVWRYSPTSVELFLVSNQSINHSPSAFSPLYYIYLVCLFIHSFIDLFVCLFDIQEPVDTCQCSTSLSSTSITQPFHPANKRT